MAGRDDDPFRRVLRGLVGEVPGAWGAIFVDWEGEAVELFATTDEYEVKLAGAHTGLLLTRLVTSGKDASLGRTTSFHLRTDEAAYFLHTLDEEYFVLLAGLPRTPAGFARQKLASAVTALRAHL